MKIDFSEPECSNCFHCRSLGILNTQESEPGYVIVSSDTSMPVSSGPVQALEHDSTAVGSTSKSSSVQAISHDSAAVGSTSTSSPVQALGHDDSAAVGSTSTSSPVKALGHDDSAAVGSTSKLSPVQALGHDDSAAVGSTSISSPVQALGHDDSAAVGSSSTLRLGSQTPSAPPVVTAVSSGPARTLDLTSFRSDASGAPTVQATSGSGAAATSTSSISSLFQSSPFGFAPAVTSVNSAPTTQAFGQTTCGFGSSPNGSESPFAITSVSSAPTQAFGPNSFGFGASATSTSSTSSSVHSSSLFGSSPAITSVSSAPTQAFGPNTCGFNPFATQPRLGSMQAPAQATSSFGTSSSTTPSLFGSMQAPVQANIGSGASGTSTSSSFLPFGCVPAPPTNGSSLFGPMQNSPWTTNSLSTGGSVDWVRSDVGVLPATPSSNVFGPNPSTPTEVFGATPGSVSWPGLSSPSYPFGQSPYTTGRAFIDYQLSRQRRYAPTPDGEEGGMYTSISASHPHKNHEELRWDDYNRGNKGSKTNAVFGSPQMSSPMFASPSVPDHPQRTTFGTPQETSTDPGFSFSQHDADLTGFGTQFPNSSPISSSVERPHETAAVSSPASGCTACGATTSTSASGYSYFDGATLATPSAATTDLPGQFYPTYGYGPTSGYGHTYGYGPSYGYVPIYGYGPPYGYVPTYGYGPTYGNVPTYGNGPMMFGANPGAQVTTPAHQAYPFNGYI